MKKTLFAALLALACASTAKSQTKGTNAIGIGVGFSEREIEYDNELSSSSQTTKSNHYSLSYDHFIKDNVKVGITGNYFVEKSEVVAESYLTKSNGYGGSAKYQTYYPLFNKFYAFAGATGGYTFMESKYRNGNAIYATSSKTNIYNVGAFGGAAYFISKRFVFETSLLSAGVSYSKQKNMSNNSKVTSTNFNVSSSGSLTNLGFNIYFLF